MEYKEPIRSLGSKLSFCSICSIRMWPRTCDISKKLKLRFQLFLNGEYTKALKSYTNALDLKPGDKNCLVARSKCYLHIGDPESALKDADECIKDDKQYHKEKGRLSLKMLRFVTEDIYEICRVDSAL